MSILKPVSPQARSFLSLLGETPQEHQNQLMKQEWKKSHSTKKEPTLRERNRETELKLHPSWSQEDLKELTQNLEEKSKETQFLPHSYILYLRESRCNNCGGIHVSMDIPQILLKQVPLKQTSLNTILYTPVYILNKELPRIKETTIVYISYCENCFLSN